MSDLISRSALLKSYDIAKMVEYDETGCGVTRIAIPVQAIKDAPTIDAVPVVRCKDCKFRGFDFCPMCHDEYTYDEAGNLIKYSTVYPDGQKSITETEYTFVYIQLELTDEKFEEITDRLVSY
jgi:hypothetical protein